MIIEVGYWTKVFKRISIILATIICLYLSFKLAVFYMPFLIAFIISLLLEPLVRLVMRKTKLLRKVSAIIVLIFVFSIVAILLVLGITALISEASNLLHGFNEYSEKLSNLLADITNSFNYQKFKISEQTSKIFENSISDVLSSGSNMLKNFLTSVLQTITAIPKFSIYFIITILSIIFISTDRIYILDQIEHHLPRTWAKKMGIHLHDLIKELGSYLKAQVNLIIITFFEVLIGLYIMKFSGLNIQYPLIAALGIGFVDALPILGVGSVLIPWAVISSLNGDINIAIGLIILYFIILVVRQILEPKIVSKHIGIHPILTLIGMYTGFKIIGILGLIMGPIVLIILKNVFSTLLEQGVVKSILDRK